MSAAEPEYGPSMTNALASKTDAREIRDAKPGPNVLLAEIEQLIERTDALPRLVRGVPEPDGPRTESVSRMPGMGDARSGSGDADPIGCLEMGHDDDREQPSANPMAAGSAT
jgi:hypothetical protein